MSLEHKTPALSVAGVRRKTGESRGEESVSRRAGLLLAVIGAALITLAAGDAPASTILDRSDDTSRGTATGNVLIGLSGPDRMYGLAGDDSLAGGSGADEIYGGPGRDVLLGGRGGDFIESKDGSADYIDCGAGADVASVDDRDRIAPGCETVYPG